MKSRCFSLSIVCFLGFLGGIVGGKRLAPPPNAYSIACSENHARSSNNKKIGEEPGNTCKANRKDYRFKFLDLSNIVQHHSHNSGKPNRRKNCQKSEKSFQVSISESKNQTVEKQKKKKNRHQEPARIKSR